MVHQDSGQNDMTSPSVTVFVYSKEIADNAAIRSSAVSLAEPAPAERSNVQHMSRSSDKNFNELAS